MMKIPCLKLAPVLLSGLFVTGCQTLPVVPHALNCDANAELLAGKCAAPRQVSNNTTYAALVDTMQADRKALQECGIMVDTLRNTLNRCNQAADEYNKKIDALNSTK